MFLRDIQAKSGMVGNYDINVHSYTEFLKELRFLTAQRAIHCTASLNKRLYVYTASVPQ